MQYLPHVFLTDNEADAKSIILTPDNGLSTEERWARETAWLLPRLQFPAGGTIVDFGCGIGRIAKNLCGPNAVLGVDLSPTMRAQAEQYVAHPAFAAVTPYLFATLVGGGFRAVGALSLWVLQHTFEPAEDVAAIAAALPPGAPFYVLNCTRRYLPTTEGWIDDGKDVERLLAERFDVAQAIALPAELFNPHAYFRRYVRRQ